MKKMSYKFKEIFENATSQGYRSNVVKPLMGLIIITLVFSAIFAFLNKEVLSIISMITSIVIIVVFLIGYIYCLLNNPDLLRSEKFILEKSIIEQTSMTGDSTTKYSLNNPDMDYTVVESIEDIPVKTIEK